LCHKILYPTRDFREKECQAHGLSIYISREDAEAKQRVVPAMRKKVLATAQLCPEHGVFKGTPTETDPGHHTWWVAEGLEPWVGFGPVDGVTS
jgi:hypothetical protein